MEALRSAMEARRRVDALLGAASGAEILEVRAVDAAKRRALAAAPSASALRACFPAGARVRVAEAVAEGEALPSVEEAQDELVRGRVALAAAAEERVDDEFEGSRTSAVGAAAGEVAAALRLADRCLGAAVAAKLAAASVRVGVFSALRLHEPDAKVLALLPSCARIAPAKPVSVLSRDLPQEQAALVDAPRWRSVACGEAHVLAVAEDGALYAWGSNAQGQLGLGPSHFFDFRDERRPTPVVPFCGGDLRVAVAACGATHSAVVDERGATWTWGGGGAFSTAAGDLLLCGDGFAFLGASATEEASAKVGSLAHAAAKAQRAARLKDTANERRTKQADAPPSPEDEAIMRTAVAAAVVDVPRRPSAVWLPGLDGSRVSRVACGGQHTVALVDGPMAAETVGRRLLRAAKSATRELNGDDRAWAGSGDDGGGSDDDDDGGARARRLHARARRRRALYAHLAVLNARSPLMAELILLEQREDGDDGDLLQLLVPDLRSPGGDERALLEDLFAADRYGLLDVRAKCEAAYATAASPATARDARGRPPVGGASLAKDVLARIGADVGAFAAASAGQEPSSPAALRAIHAALLHGRRRLLRPAAPPPPAARDPDRFVYRTHQHFLSLPHTLGLLALTVASLAAQQYYRLRDYAVVVVNGGFFVLAAILFWHSSKTAKRARN
ncbi:hypothetical protein SO694_000028102 [Aureococcus anophagefferens]|uniref:Uncharacterized protein n=2 Tax=Aureococcus anophagefferens TaxID=44056 RepID=A0ABR1GD13_AURAN